MTENEPSMDEILNSIHSILAEGEAEADETEVPQTPQPAVKEQAPQPPKVVREPIPTVRPSFSVRDEAPAEQAPYAPAAEESQELTEESSEDVLDLTQDMIVSRPQEMIMRQNEDGLPAEKPLEYQEYDTHFSEREYPMSQQENYQTVDDDLISADTTAAAAASLSQLTQAFSEQKRQSAVAQNGGLTLDVLVAELIKPYLKEWLDKNLPAIVDEAVQKEIARLVDRSIR